MPANAPASALARHGVAVEEVVAAFVCSSVTVFVRVTVCVTVTVVVFVAPHAESARQHPTATNAALTALEFATDARVPHRARQRLPRWEYAPAPENRGRGRSRSRPRRFARRS